MKEFFIETERLLMRPFSPKHSVHMFMLNSNERVLEHTGDDQFESIKKAEAFLKQYDQFKKYKMGRFSVFNKINNRYLGWCGLRFDEVSGTVDLGFRFSYDSWGKGFATESSSAILEYGFIQLGLEKIIARTRLANKASLRVIEKLKMEIEENFDFEGFPGAIFSISKVDYLNNKKKAISDQV